MAGLGVLATQKFHQACHQAVEATFEPSSVTKMPELDEVDAATEAASSRRGQTMDVEWLPELRCNCLRLLGHVYALYHSLL